MDIAILYEDNDLVVVDKPAGIAVHPDGRSDGPFLTDWVLEHYPETEDVGEPMILGDRGVGIGDITMGSGTVSAKAVIKRPGIVHRLDKDTSGVIVIAKTQKAYEFLKEQFQDRHASKKYVALVYGNFKNDDGVIDKPIGKSKKNYRLRDATSAARGNLRDAETEYSVLERFISPDHTADYSFLEVRPKTGRTHQIRVHMKAISHPIVCDYLYAAGRPCLPELERQALHALELTIALPGGAKETFKAPIPQDMAIALDRLRKL